MPEESAYPSNSHSDAQPPKNVERITEGRVIERKPSVMKRLASGFAGEDAHSVGGYVVFEVLLPAFKTMVSDAVSQGVERLLFGGAAPRSTSYSSGGSRTSYTQYNRFYRGEPRKDEPRTMSQRARATHDFREIILESRPEAEQVLNQLGELVDRYDVATVSDLYQMVGITGTFAEEKWGWVEGMLRQAGIRRMREGYLLELPRPIALD